MTLDIRRASELDEHEQRWLIRDILPASACGMLAGVPKAGKTFLALGLAASVASGRAFLGKQVEEPGKCLVVLGEDTESTVRQRLGDCASLVDACFDPLRLDTTTGMAEFGEAARGYRLVILDPLVRFHRSAESAVGAMVELLAGLRAVQRSTGATIMVCHHMRKGGVGGQGMRGSSELHAWVEFGLYLSPGRLDVELRMAPSWSTEFGLTQKEPAVRIRDLFKGRTPLAKRFTLGEEEFRG